MTTGAIRARASSRQLIGRLEELARLESLVEQTIAAQTARVAFLEGPAGIGKSRLAAELAAAVRRGDGAALVGHCVRDGHEVLPYAPLVELLGDLVRLEGVATLTRWAGPSAPELGRLLPALGDGTIHATGTEPVRAGPTRLFQALCSVLDHAARKRPLLVVVEDLHWADRSTRELLALLVQQLRSPALLLFTLRTDEAPRDPGVNGFVSELGRSSEQHVVLRPLSRGEQAHQVSDILGVPPTAALLDEVYRRAEGNPFFAEELLALGTPGELPPTLRDLLLTRLETLPPATRQVLRTAAVAGRRVPHSLLEAVTDVSGPHLDAALRPAVDAHVLVPDSADGGTYEFRHALLHEAVAASLLPGEATRMHRRLAETLETAPELVGSTPFVQGRIARHWFAAGDGPRALVSSVRAAREARRSLAFSESVAHYDRALRLLDGVPNAAELLDEPRYWLLWSAADVAHLAGLPERAAELVRAAIEAVDTSDPHRHGYLYERLGRYLWMGADGVGALAAYEKAVALVPPEPPTRWRGAALSGYSQILMLTSRFAESADFARQAIAVASRVADGRSVEGHARCNLGVALARLGDLDAGTAELVEARRIAEEQFDDVDDIARAIVNLQSVLADAGRLAESAQVGIESVGVVERLGLHRRKGVWCRGEAAGVLITLGRYDEAGRLVDEARALAPQGVDAVITDIARGRLLHCLGRYDEALSCLEAAHRSGGQILDGQLVGPLYAALVEVTTWRQEYDAATSWAQVGRTRLRANEDAAYAVPLYAAAVRAEVERSLTARSRSRDADESATVTVESWLELADQSLQRTPADAPVAAAADATARCEARRLEGAHTPDDWTAVVATWQEVGDPYRTAYARVRRAEARLCASDRAGARDDLRTARTGAETLGAAGLVALTDQVATRARLVLDDSARTPDGGTRFRLTPRERDVLALVAEGLTDRQIGTQLFISPRTVERHVSNLLAKLDATRRTQLAAAAHREGLLER